MGLDGQKLRMHATAEVQRAGKVFFSKPVHNHCVNKGFCPRVQALTFFPFFLAFPVLEVCGGGGPVVHGLAALLVVCAFRLL